MQVVICDNQTAWVRHLSNGSVAVALPNLGAASANMRICFADVGWPGATATVRNVWAKTTTAAARGQYAAQVDTHDTLLVILSK